MLAAETFHGGSVVAAWREAAKAVASSAGTAYLLVVTAGVGWKGEPDQTRALDDAAAAVGAERPSSVAGMLLPRVVQLSTENADHAIEAGLRMLGRGRKRGLRFSGWSHTYFERLAGAWFDRFGKRKEIRNNKLLGVIQKLNEWDRNAEAVFYIHTALDGDTFRPRGSPCLQYVQFRAHSDRKLSIVALYRAHDYTNKFLGNAIGLQRLGEFVARHTGRELDSLAIVSLNPFCENKTQLRRFTENAPDG